MPKGHGNRRTSEEARSIFRRKFFRGVGWLSASSPLHWMGVKSIRQGRLLYRRPCRTHDSAPRAMRDSRLKTEDEAGQFDLQCDSVQHGHDGRAARASLGRPSPADGHDGLPSWRARPDCFCGLVRQGHLYTDGCRTAGSRGRLPTVVRVVHAARFLSSVGQLPDPSRAHRGAGESIWQPTRVSGHARRPETSQARCTHH